MPTKYEVVLKERDDFSLRLRRINRAFNPKTKLGVNNSAQAIAYF
jgi:hypothetical protein